MSIEQYFQQIQGIVAGCQAMQASNIQYDKRGTYEGYVRGELYFIDSSVLHLREYVDVEREPERLMYVYQYMNSSNDLIFRYDNTGHHREISTYPHHKHEGLNNEILPSSPVNLTIVLAEIEQKIEIPG